MGVQDNWRYCWKCETMFFDGYAQKGSCPGGGGHEASGYMFDLPHDLPSTPTAQDSWRYCEKCHGIYYDGFPYKGVCASDHKQHVAQGYDFVLPHDVSQTWTAQSNWRYCENCHGLFWDGYAEKGACPAGGKHVANGWNFVLPHDLPQTLDYDWNPIVFDGGVPVGGNAHLTIRADGSYTFSGHFHDSGATEYNMGLVWVVKDSQNMVYTFTHSGHVAGTFESGSRNDDWIVDSRNDEIANRWANIAAGATWTARADANMDIMNLLNTAIGAVGTALGIIAIV